MRSDTISGVGRDAVVRQAVPGGKPQDLDVGREHGERLGQARHAGVVAGDVDDAAFVLGPAPRQQQRVEALRRAVDDRRQQDAAPRR